MDYQPQLRKKRTASDKKKGKVFVYNQKSIRIREGQLGNQKAKNPIKDGT